MSQYRYGARKTKTYWVWAAMLQRCLNPSNKSYKNYGLKGIGVHPSWRSFAVFYADMGDPSDGYTLERKDNTQGYSKDNCIWATRAQQSRNTKRTKQVALGQNIQCLKDICIQKGLVYSSIHGRIRKGMSVETALTTEIKKPRRYAYNGVSFSLSEWGVLLGVNRDTLKSKLLRGASFSKAIEPYLSVGWRC